MQEVNQETNQDEFVIGDYHTQEFIGHSTTGSVYKAFNESTGDVVAIKILKHELGKHEKFMQCLKEEMSIVKKLQHPNIVKVMEVAKDKDKRFLVLEYVDGKNLKEIFEENPKLPISQCIEIMMQISLALDYSAENGVLHKSIKPQSIMISNSNWVKLTGFGVSKALATAWLTLTGSSNAQVEYMSPEQAEGEDSDQRSDIYSFGILAYQMLTGEVPFKREKSASILSVAMKHINDIPVPLSQKNPEIPDWLEKVVLKCLEKKPTNRYQRGKDVFEDLKNKSFSGTTSATTETLENTSEEVKNQIIEMKEVISSIPSQNKNVKDLLVKKVVHSTPSINSELNNDSSISAPPPPPPPPKISNPMEPVVVVRTENSSNISSEELKNSFKKKKNEDKEPEKETLVAKNSNKMLILLALGGITVFVLAMIILLNSSK